MFGFIGNLAHINDGDEFEKVDHTIYTVRTET